MTRVGAFYRSILGKKIIVAVTGMLMLGFLVLHVIGNLHVFLPDARPGVPDVDVYAEFLQTMGAPILPRTSGLWMIRIVMLISIGLHVICVVQLAQHNRRARPIRYQHSRKFEEATIPARAMLYTGTLIVLFVGFHLLQFTFGVVDASRFTNGAVYANLYRAFQLPGYVALYMVAMGIIAFHLYHGAWSLFQTLGVDNPDRNRGLRLLAKVVAAGLFVAFTSVPVSFYACNMSEPTSQSTHPPAASSR